MANSYGLREWKLDTVGTITTDRVRVKRMEWVPNAANDDLLVDDSAGQEIWEVTNALTGGRAGLEMIEFGSKGHDVDGFVLTTLGGGALYVWLC